MVSKGASTATRRLVLTGNRRSSGDARRRTFGERMKLSTRGDPTMTTSAFSTSRSGTQLASDRPIGQIEPVFEFYDAMPTGVTVAASGRVFINFPRWGDDVPFTVGEIR